MGLELQPLMKLSPGLARSSESPSNIPVLYNDQIQGLYEDMRWGGLMMLSHRIKGTVFKVKKQTKTNQN